jgi:hypothetical protein
VHFTKGANVKDKGAKEGCQGTGGRLANRRKRLAANIPPARTRQPSPPTADSSNGMPIIMAIKPTPKSFSPGDLACFQLVVKARTA